jgi:hypothetical protein
MKIAFCADVLRMVTAGYPKHQKLISVILHMVLHLKQLSFRSKLISLYIGQSVAEQPTN